MQKKASTSKSKELNPGPLLAEICWRKFILCGYLVSTPHFCFGHLLRGEQVLVNIKLYIGSVRSSLILTLVLLSNKAPGTKPFLLCKRNMQHFSLSQDLFLTPATPRSPSRLSLKPSSLAQRSQCTLSQTPTLAFSNSNSPAPRRSLTLLIRSNLLLERLETNSTQSDDCQIKSSCAVEPHAAYQSQGDVLWWGFFLRLESQAFWGKCQVPVKRTGWVGPKIGGSGRGAGWQVNTRRWSKRWAHASLLYRRLSGWGKKQYHRASSGICFIAFIYYSSRWDVSRKTFTICKARRGAPRVSLVPAGAAHGSLAILCQTSNEYAVTYFVLQEINGAALSKAPFEEQSGAIGGAVRAPQRAQVDQEQINYRFEGISPPTLAPSLSLSHIHTHTHDL